MPKDYQRGGMVNHKSGAYLAIQAAPTVKKFTDEP
jgi:hypothetical protein